MLAVFLPFGSILAVSVYVLYSVQSLTVSQEAVKVSLGSLSWFTGAVATCNTEYL